MATGALKFFNPSSLLPSPDVAINPTPVADHSAIGLAMFDALKTVRETAKQKRDLENLKSETMALADYFGTNSPQLKDFLYKKADSYDLLTTDTARERAGLLTGSIGLFGAESARIKAEKDANDILVDNNWKTKVTLSEKRYEALMRAKQRHQEEQNNLKIQHNTTRRLMAEDGIPTPEFIEQPFAEQAELDAAKDDLDRKANAGVDEIRRDATSRSAKNSIVGGAPMPTGGPEDDMPSKVDLKPGDAVPESILSGAPPPAESVAREGSLFPEALEPPPKAPTDNTPAPTANAESPQLTEDAEGPSGILTRHRNSQQKAQSILPNDMFNQAAKQRQAEFKEIENGKVIEISQMLSRLEQNRDAYPERVQPKIDALLASLESRKDEVEQAGKDLKLGGKAWEQRLKNITKLVEGDIRALRPLTNDEQDRRELAESNRTFEFYQEGDSPDDKTKRFIVEKRIRPSDRRTRLYAIDRVTGEINRDVTTMFREGTIKPAPGVDVKELQTDLLESEDTQNGNVDVAKPGAKLPINRWLNRGKGNATSPP